MRLIKTILIVAVLALFTQRTFADEQFDTSYEVSYHVSEDGVTTVEQNITIINNKEDVLATTYSHSINQMDIYDVKARDGKGEIEVTRKDENGVITIKLNLKEQVIGKGRENKIELSYKTKSIASKLGGIWNLNLPQISGLDNIKDYTTQIFIPKSFGPEIFISPIPTRKTDQGEYNTYFFDKESIKDGGISASFGVYQTVNFRLKYHLKNDSWLPVFQEIALPPDIAGFQQVLIENIIPYPKKMYLDADGNLMAKYRLSGGEDLDIQALGGAKISGKQIVPANGGKMHELPKNLIRDYTQEKPYWDTSSEVIKSIADDLFEPEKTVAQNAQKIYDYITQNYEYNFEIVNEDYIDRKGALWAAEKKGKLACMEFTDLFIAIARATGIPARELNGYAPDTNSPLSVDWKLADTLHSWPQFYDPELGWVMIDPTWGTTSKTDYFTKLDTNHFVFAIKGLDSEYPYPAGSYKLDADEKQVEVDFAQQELTSKEFVTLFRKTDIVSNLINKVTKKISYVAMNKSGYVIYDFNETGRTLFPMEKTSVTLRPGEKPVYQDFNGVQRTLPTKIEDEKLSNIKIYTIGGALLATGLCTTLYFLIKKSKAQRK
ncbi:MAG: transglutaminase family protein [Patescibacteria group bacterium]|jgi:transglutaminase-like putative cysteine protease